MNPTISIALITLGLTFPAPAAAVDYVQCEAMRRRLRIDSAEKVDRAEQARLAYFLRTAPPKPKPKMTAEECRESLSPLCLPVPHFDRIPSVGTPRWKEGDRIYAEVAQQPTENTKRIVDDMNAAGCF